jgi:hypothetical protein
MKKTMDFTLWMLGAFNRSILHLVLLSNSWTGTRG